MDAKNLAQIHEETGKHRFRVRDVNTLEDHLMLCVVTYVQGIPMMYSGVRLDGKRFSRELYQSRESKYCLLSCEAERQFWLKLGETQAVFQAKRSYKMANS